MNDELNKQMEKLIQTTRAEERDRLLVNLPAVIKVLNTTGIQLCRYDGRTFQPVSKTDQVTDLRYALEEVWPEAE